MLILMYLGATVQGICRQPLQKGKYDLLRLSSVQLT